MTPIRGLHTLLQDYQTGDHSILGLCPWDVRVLSDFVDWVRTQRSEDWRAMLPETDLEQIDSIMANVVKQIRDGTIPKSWSYGMIIWRLVAALETVWETPAKKHYGEPIQNTVDLQRDWVNHIENINTDKSDLEKESIGVGRFVYWLKTQGYSIHKGAERPRSYPAMSTKQAAAEFLERWGNRVLEGRVSSLTGTEKTTVELMMGELSDMGWTLVQTQGSEIDQVIESMKGHGFYPDYPETVEGEHARQMVYKFFNYWSMRDDVSPLSGIEKTTLEMFSSWLADGNYIVTQVEDVCSDCNLYPCRCEELKRDSAAREGYSWSEPHAFSGLPGAG